MSTPIRSFSQALTALEAAGVPVKHLGRDPGLKCLIWQVGNERLTKDQVIQRARLLGDTTPAVKLAEALLGAGTAAIECYVDGSAETVPFVPVSIGLPLPVATALVELVDARKVDVFSFQLFCRVCGCTDDYACDGGCEWVDADLCSACVGREVAHV